MFTDTVFSAPLLPLNPVLANVDDFSRTSFRFGLSASCSAASIQGRQWSDRHHPALQDGGVSLSTCAFAVNLSNSLGGLNLAGLNLTGTLALGTIGTDADPIAGETRRISLTENGTQGNGNSLRPAISADGRYVAFTSAATNLVAGDTNGKTDVFVRDRLSGAITRISVASDGTQANDHSNLFAPAISADGRYVAFQSRASNLVAGDTNGIDDIFVHDRVTGITTRVSVASDGTQANNPGTNVLAVNSQPAISGDGRYITFASAAANLVEGDTNGSIDVFVHDRLTGQTTRVSVAFDGSEANLSSYAPSISADGRVIAFVSVASNLVPGDTNATSLGSADVFVHDRLTGETSRVNLAADGSQANPVDPSVLMPPVLSGDGRYVVFQSVAANLVENDTNNAADIFVYDRQTGQTSRVTVASDGSQVVGNHGTAAISGDGRYITFSSSANNLVTGDTNGRSDIFVHDQVTGTTNRISRASDGSQGSGSGFFGSLLPSISADGRFVAFQSDFTNLVPGDTNGRIDLFVRDLAPASLPALFVQDAIVTEGDSDTRNATLTVRLNVASPLPVIVNYSTADDSATSNDYVSSSGSLIFNPGETSQAITISILGDTLSELDKTFTVNLTSPVNATIFDAQATVTVLDNDPHLTIGNQTIVEGDNGSTNAVFTVSLTQPSSQIVMVDYTTGDRTATAGSDYTAMTGTLVFNPGETSQALTIPILTDTQSEFTETFWVNLSNPSNAVLAKAQALGTIQDDDPLVPAGSITRISVADDGTQANGKSGIPVLSADGRYLAFASDAANLVPDDTNGVSDVFVRDRLTGTITRISLASDGTQGNGVSGEHLAISGDGRYITFTSAANNLVVGDTNGASDIFLHDRLTGETRRISTASDGSEANGSSAAVAISGDGRYLAFTSAANNLVAGDTNGVSDIFLHDRLTGETRRISTASDGSEANGSSAAVAISADGQWISFTSTASNLVTADTNNAADVFVYDRLAGTTARVNVASDGTQANAGSLYGSDVAPAISADGRYVVFQSLASNLVDGDTNGIDDVFVHDRLIGTTTRVSVNTRGDQSIGNPLLELGTPSISADGRYVVFASGAGNLVPGDTNQAIDVFLHDQATGETNRISVAANGTQAIGGYSLVPAISADGRYVVFYSDAANLVEGDTNGVGDIFLVDRLG